MAQPTELTPLYSQDLALLLFASIISRETVNTVGLARNVNLAIQEFARDGFRKGGCTIGRNFQDFHPNTCWESLKSKPCSRKKCRYFHLNGTKLTNENRNLGGNMVYNQTENQQQNPRQKNSKMTDQPLRQNSSIPRLDEHHATIFPSQVSEINIRHCQDFLVVDQRM